MPKKILFYFLLLTVLSGCSHPSLLKETSILMDTIVEISCFSRDKDAALNAMKDAFKEIERIGRVFSKFDAKSELSKMNALAGKKEVAISPELFKLIGRSIYYSRISGGSFDITVMPLKKGRYKDIVLNRDKTSIFFSDDDIKIDLGGIAKGYAVDRAKEILRSYGIKNALVNIGGNMFALGSPPHKDSWRIGIRDPRNKNGIIYRLNLKNRAVSTSGNYERPFHIINPMTGEPSGEVMSVTIVAPSAEEADALSTAIFVMGAKQGLGLVKSLKGVEAYIFDKNASLITYPQTTSHLQ